MLPRTKIYLTTVGIIVIAVIAGLWTWPKGPDWPKKEMKLHLGLDLAGGAELVFQADLKDTPLLDKADSLDGARDVIERRVNALGVSEPEVYTTKGDRIVVELPGIADVKQAVQKIGETPVLEFKEQSQPETLSAEEKQQAEVYNQTAQTKAAEILKNLIGQTDEEFAKVAQEISEDPGSKEKGGDLGFAQAGMFVPEFEEVLFNQLKDGETYPELVKTQFGYHIIRRIESRCVNEKEDNKVTPCPEINQTDLSAVEDQPAVNPDIKQEARGRHILIQIKSTEIRPPAEVWRNTNLSGKQLKRADVKFDPQTGMPIVGLIFNKQGGDLFAEITGRNVDKVVAIFLDNEIISAPRVNEKIEGGEAVISGSFSAIEARDLAKRLNAGALPVPIQLIAEQQIGASLGKIAVQKSFLAAILGLVLILIFMSVYYRASGLIASLALIIYSLISIAIFKLIPITLTLSGVAGFIMSIGMAVDANVLIFERMKEEQKLGKTRCASIDEGFRRAWPSIRDSNVSTLLTCFILIWFGTSLIKGFAFTLSIGILVSMFSAIIITKTLLKLFVMEKER